LTLKTVKAQAARINTDEKQFSVNRAVPKSGEDLSIVGTDPVSDPVSF
jgi:hypothetical protein